MQLAQRAHLNYLETLSLSLWALVISGIFFPFYAGVLSVVHIIGRQLYCSGFRSRAGLRGVGYAVSMLSLLAWIVLGGYGSVQLILSH